MFCCLFTVYVFVFVVGTLKYVKFKASVTNKVVILTLPNFNSLKLINEWENDSFSNVTGTLKIIRNEINLGTRLKELFPRSLYEPPKIIFISIFIDCQKRKKICFPDEYFVFFRLVKSSKSLSVLQVVVWKDWKNWFLFCCYLMIIV